MPAPGTSPAAPILAAARAPLHRPGEHDNDVLVSYLPQHRIQLGNALVYCVNKFIGRAILLTNVVFAGCDDHHLAPLLHDGVITNGIGEVADPTPRHTKNVGTKAGSLRKLECGV